MTTIAAFDRFEVESDPAIPETFELLADAHRQAILIHLATNGGHATLSELATELEFRETSRELGVASAYGVDTADERSRRISLHHVHIPKLADAKAVDYDAKTKTVTLRETGHSLLARLEAICGTPRDTYDVSR